jgi:hypothetical protein
MIRRRNLLAEYLARKTAILWNHENLWNIDNQKQTALWDTWSHLFRYLESAKSLGAPVDFISECGRIFAVARVDSSGVSADR